MTNDSDRVKAFFGIFLIICCIIGFYVIVYKLAKRFDCILFIVCLFSPPFAVIIRRGCTVHVCINLLFTVFGYIPGMIHAIYVCFYDRPPVPMSPPEYYHVTTYLEGNENTNPSNNGGGVV